jgi:type VI secretion system protein ImpL
MQNVRPGVAGLYAKDYIAAWEGVIKIMQPAAYFSDPAAFGAFTKSPSPVKRVLLELRKNTIFGGGVAGAAGRQLGRKLSSSRAGLLVNDLNTGRSTGLSAGDEITNYFSALHEYVGDPKAGGPIDDFVAAVKSAGQAVIAAKSLGGGGGSDATQAQMATAMASVATAAATAPAQLQPFVAAASKGGSSAQVSAVQGAVSDAYAQSVMPACKEVAQDRYPFFGGATQDVAVPDALRVFGMGGTLDGFQRLRLASLMDISGPVWRWKADDPIAATLDPQSPEQFSKAAQIRDLLAAGLPLKIAVAEFGSEVDTAQFSSGGATYKFSKTDTAEKPLLWSASGGVPSAEVVLYAPAGAQAAAGLELRRFDAEGPWALFKLIDKATKENAGPTAFKATFGEGSKAVTFLIKLPSTENPFSRGGVWSFRCPLKL